MGTLSTTGSAVVQGTLEVGGDIIADSDLNVSSGNITAGSVSVSTGVTINALKVPVVHGTGTVAQAIESGAGAANASGVKAVTFATAFSVAPNCVCADTNAAPVACGISTAASTTAVTFTIGSARADTIQWYCVGAR